MHLRDFVSRHETIKYVKIWENICLSVMVYVKTQLVKKSRKIAGCKKHI